MTCQICLIIKLKHDPILATSSISNHLLTVLESRECKKLSLFKSRAWVVIDHFLRVGSKVIVCTTIGGGEKRMHEYIKNINGSYMQTKEGIFYFRDRNLL